MRGLYAIIDPEQCEGREPSWVASEVLRGGCAALQLRAKELDDDDFLALGRHLVRLCERANVPFFVNDRVWLAHELGASGVHLGQGDMPLAAARQQLGTSMKLGLSTHTLDQARHAEAAGADLIGFGPVFETKSKAVAEPAVGLAALSAVCAALRIPVVAIGGISVETAAEVAATGAPLVAVIRAICAASDPERAASVIHQAVHGT